MKRMTMLWKSIRSRTWHLICSTTWMEALISLKYSLKRLLKLVGSQPMLFKKTTLLKVRHSQKLLIAVKRARIWQATFLTTKNQRKRRSRSIWEKHQMQALCLTLSQLLASEETEQTQLMITSERLQIKRLKTRQMLRIQQIIGCRKLKALSQFMKKRMSLKLKIRQVMLKSPKKSSKMFSLKRKTTSSQL